MQIPGSIPMAATTQSNSTDPTDNSNNSQDGSMITANDFLTLLVTELKNQDPTANTDPNAYVDQLVQVNSLQQLIQINQNTTSTTGSTTPTGSGS
jgi:flagellar basal-body rod modification protein FlgD